MSYIALLIEFIRLNVIPKEQTTLRTACLTDDVLFVNGDGDCPSVLLLLECATKEEEVPPEIWRLVILHAEECPTCQATIASIKLLLAKGGSKEEVLAGLGYHDRAPIHLPE
ncbi:MAG: hypothetical protein A2666_03845 [Parcubacteria group bacterium RIFCSPHIGHO2_01_FULL_47_10b]|nr:MAG: hypothetical protein A2666_03845 [Parcubacteria group bacterium RIFCSPHIGHO2_01_FULL_47_10b]